MATQKAELRVVIQRGGDYGLLWQATLRKDDLFAGLPDGMVPWARISYHASGKTHIYPLSRRERIEAADPSPALRELVGTEKVGAWGLSGVRWGYHPKRDAQHRRLAIFTDPAPSPLTVDLWVIQPSGDHLVPSILGNYSQFRLLAQLHVSVTSPQLFAVVYTMTDRMLESFFAAVRKD